jgi:hypothetical protein
VCKSCRSEYQKGYRQAYYESRIKKERENDKKRWHTNNGRRKKYIRNRNLLKKYGITLDDYNSLLESQDYKCALCGKNKEEEYRSFCVDHNHITGHIRGLLCTFCNSWLLRALRDNKHITIGLINYLTKALQEDKNWE